LDLCYDGWKSQFYDKIKPVSPKTKQFVALTMGLLVGQLLIETAKSRKPLKSTQKEKDFEEYQNRLKESKKSNSQ